MLRAVDDVLEEIGAGDRPRLLVLNKADAARRRARARSCASAIPTACSVSALTGEGLDELRERDRAASSRARCSRVELLLPYAEGGRLAELHDVAGDLRARGHRRGRARRARALPATVAERFERFAVNGAPQA